MIKHTQLIHITEKTDRNVCKHFKSRYKNGTYTYHIMNASEIILNLSITLNDIAREGTERLTKYVNHDLCKILGVDSCFMSLKSSTMLSTLPRSGSLIHFPFTYYDSKGNEKSGVFFITWVKLLDENVKQEITKLATSIAKLLANCLLTSLQIDDLKQSVTLNQVQFLSELSNVKDYNRKDLFELGGKVSNFIQHSLASSLWIVDGKNDRQKVILSTAIKDKALQTLVGNTRDIIALTYEYGNTINIANVSERDIYIPETNTIINKKENSENGEKLPVPNHLSAISVPIYNSLSNEKYGALLITRFTEYGPFTDGELAFIKSCSGIIAKSIYQLNISNNYKTKSQKVEDLKLKVMKKNRMIEELKEKLSKAEKLSIGHDLEMLDVKDIITTTENNNIAQQNNDGYDTASSHSINGEQVSIEKQIQLEEEIADLYVCLLYIYYSN